MYCEKRVVIFCGGEEGEKEAAGGRGIMEMEIVNVLLGGDGWGYKKRGGELRLRSWKWKWKWNP